MNGKDLMLLRKKFNLTQKDLAKMLGVAHNTVYNYEKGGNIPTSKIAILRKLSSELEGASQINSGIINNGKAKRIHQDNSVSEAKDLSDIINLFEKQLDKKDEQIDKLLNILSKQ